MHRLSSKERQALLRKHAGVQYCGLCAKKFGFFGADKKQCWKCTFVYCQDCTQKRLASGQLKSRPTSAKQRPSRTNSITSEQSGLLSSNASLSLADEFASAVQEGVDTLSAAFRALTSTAGEEKQSLRLCHYCIEMACISAMSEAELKALPVSSLSAFIEAYGLFMHDGAEVGEEHAMPFLEKAELVQCVHHFDTPNAFAEAHYRTKAPGYHFYILRHDDAPSERPREPGLMTNFIALVRQKQAKGLYRVVTPQAPLHPPSQPQAPLHPQASSYRVPPREGPRVPPQPYSGERAEMGPPPPYSFAEPGLIPEMRRTHLVNVPTFDDPEPGFLEPLEPVEVEQVIPSRAGTVPYPSAHPLPRDAPSQTSTGDTPSRQGHTGETRSREATNRETEARRARMNREPFVETVESSSDDEEQEAVAEETPTREAEEAEDEAMPEVLPSRAGTTPYPAPQASHLPHRTPSPSSQASRDPDYLLSLTNMLHCYEQPDALRVLSMAQLRRLLEDKHVPYGDVLERQQLEERVYHLLDSMFGAEVAPAAAPSPVATDDHLCKICFETEISVLFLECAHVCACEPCSRQLVQCPVVPFFLTMFFLTWQIERFL